LQGIKGEKTCQKKYGKITIYLISKHNLSAIILIGKETVRVTAVEKKHKITVPARRSHSNDCFITTADDNGIPEKATNIEISYEI
jgi:hypothetical protein